MGIEQIRIAPKSRWQNCYVERVIGSIRCECLDHVIVINDRHLRRLLTEYFRYYHKSRTHLSLEKDSPESRAVQSNKAESIIQLPQVGGPSSLI
jgi:putative transposase